MKHIGNTMAVKQQSEFCTELMCRLNGDIQSAEYDSGDRLAKHTQMESDARRIRRELSTLCKMLEGER